jgi:hypothetical protein
LARWVEPHRLVLVALLQKRRLFSSFRTWHCGIVASPGLGASWPVGPSRSLHSCLCPALQARAAAARRRQPAASPTRCSYHQSLPLAAGARRGLLLRGGDVLERLAQVDTVVLDKTGTLTQGRLQVGFLRGVLGSFSSFCGCRHPPAAVCYGCPKPGGQLPARPPACLHLLAACTACGESPQAPSPCFLCTVQLAFKIMGRPASMLTMPAGQPAGCRWPFSWWALGGRRAGGRACKGIKLLTRLPNVNPGRMLASVRMPIKVIVATSPRKFDH